ncbi:MAG: hypothetical protein LBI86_06375 [Treponema sp.]|nr:hypothetical protein [Treponema sp.]
MIFLLLAEGVPCLWAVDFSVRAKPYMSFPSAKSAELFGIGGGADAVFDVDISSVLRNPFDLGYSISPEFGFGISSLNGAEGSPSFLSGGIGFSLFYYPLSRLNLRAGGSFGFYQSAFDGMNGRVTYSNAYWRFGGEAGFRFSPLFTLSAGGGFRQYTFRPGNPVYEGIYVGLTAQISFETGGGNNGVQVALRQSEPVFPVFSGLYQQNQIGVIRITNDEPAEIRNITVSFRAGNYTASEMICGTVARLGKHRTAEIPLYADFSRSILNFSDNGRIPGEIMIRYEFLGSTRTLNSTALVDVYSRNSFRWSDPSALAVFVSPAAPEVLDFSKYIVGFSRNYLKTALNRNMQFAVFLFEGLRAGNINRVPDIDTPFTELHRSPSRVDFIQFPFQTLAYRSGDLDDLGLLFAACLEAVGISTALIPLDDDFVVAFSLDIDEAAAKNFFEDMENLLVMDGEVWMPVAFSAFRDGFVNSWYAAAREINAVLAAGLDLNPVVLSDAWRLYSPAVLNTQEARIDKPPETDVARLAGISMARYIASEMGPKIQAALGDIRVYGGSEERYNRLGLLYVRSGMYGEAKAEYRRSAEMGSVAAMVNLGNLAVLENDFAAAEDWFGRALTADPGNRIAMRGLGRIALDRPE